MATATRRTAAADRRMVDATSRMAAADRRVVDATRPMATTDRRIVDVANARGMRSEALEIFLGLVYLDYTDDPLKEARGH